MKDIFGMIPAPSAECRVRSPESPSRDGDSGLRTRHSALGAGIMPKMSFIDEIPVIDADGHVEPAIAADWWRYVPGPDGPAVAAEGARIFDRIGDFSGTRRGAWDAEARLVDMDAEGIQ